MSSGVTSDGIQHVYSATSGGGIYETYWGAGVPLTTSQIATVGTGVVAATAWVT